MSLFKRRCRQAALDGAVSTYRVQRCLGYSVARAMEVAAHYYADMTGSTWASAHMSVGASLELRRNREIPGGTL